MIGTIPTEVRDDSPGRLKARGVKELEVVWSWGDSVVENLSSMHKTPSSIPSTRERSRGHGNVDYLSEVIGSLKRLLSRGKQSNLCSEKMG